MIADLRGAVPKLAPRISDVGALALAVDLAAFNLDACTRAAAFSHRMRKAGRPAASVATCQRWVRHGRAKLEAAKEAWRAVWIAEGRQWRSPE